MEQSCDKEHSFKSRKDAHKQLRHMNSRRGRHKYRLYKCDKCGDFHIATVTKNLTTPKRMNKYPLNLERQGSSKIKDVPEMGGIPKQSKPPTHQRELATEKLISKQQADALKKIIELNNPHT